MGDPKDSFITNPEEYVLITDIEQVVSVYPELFEHVNANPSPFFQANLLHCEVEMYKGQNRINQRFILFRSGIVSLGALDGQDIWEIDFHSQEGEALLLRLDAEVRDRIYGYQDDLTPSIDTEAGEYSLRIFPYNDQEASQIVIFELDTKYSEIN